MKMYIPTTLIIIPTKRPPRNLDGVSIIRRPFSKLPTQKICFCRPRLEPKSCHRRLKPAWRDDSTESSPGLSTARQHYQAAGSSPALSDLKSVLLELSARGTLCLAESISMP